MKRYIDADALKERVKSQYCEGCNNYNGIRCGSCDIDFVFDMVDDAPTADVVKHGEWALEIMSYYPDDWDEDDITFNVYISAKCPYCSQKHIPNEVFGKRYHTPEGAPEDFSFNRAEMIAKALNEFKQENYKFLNFCPCCGAKMDGEKVK